MMLSRSAVKNQLIAHIDVVIVKTQCLHVRLTNERARSDHVVPRRSRGAGLANFKPLKTLENTVNISRET